MRGLLLITLLLFFSGPSDLLAERSHYRAHHRTGIRTHADIRSRLKMPARLPSQDMRSRLKMPVRLPRDVKFPGKPVHPIYPGEKPCKPGHGRPAYWWPVSTTVVREPQPIIIVDNPPPAAPTAPKPEKVWVPPVMDTRTEPGYWDYGISKTWMGDHWRYGQDQEKRTWVPAFQVKYIKQEGYWKIVE